MGAPSPARVVVSEPASGDQKAQPHVHIGRLLVDSGLITEEQLAEALLKQVEWGSRLGDTVLGMGWVKPVDFYQVLATRLGLDFVNLVQEPIDESLSDDREYGNYAQHLFLPWRRKGGALWIATADPTSPTLTALQSERDDVRFVVTSKFDIIWELQRVAGQRFSQGAVSGH